MRKLSENEEFLLKNCVIELGKKIRENLNKQVIVEKQKIELMMYSDNIERDDENEDLLKISVEVRYRVKAKTYKNFIDILKEEIENSIGEVSVVFDTTKKFGDSWTANAKLSFLIFLEDKLPDRYKFIFKKRTE